MALQCEGKIPLITGATYLGRIDSSWPMLGSRRDSGDNRRLISAYLDHEVDMPCARP